MKRQIKFKKNHTLRIDGKEKRFRRDDIAEIPEEEALRLFKAGIILPGPSEGGIVKNVFGEGEGGSRTREKCLPSHLRRGDFKR